MTLQERKIKVLENILDQAIDKQYELEVGIEIKELMIIQNPQHEQVAKIEQIVQQEKFMLENQRDAINILDRKLVELKTEHKAAQPSGALKA